MSHSTQPISPNDRRTVRVLVADGDAHTRELYRASLKDAGCDVVDASDGREALLKALTYRPTLIVMETRLPHFDGYDLCRVMRRDIFTASVPILVITADTRQSDWDRARQAGADVVLVKPVDPATLLAEVRRLLNPTSDSTLPASRATEGRIPGRDADRTLEHRPTRKLRRSK